MTSDIFAKPEPKTREDLERLRKLIVFVDTCLEKGTLVELDEELNRQVRFILSEEDQKLAMRDMSNINFMGYTGFMAQKMRPKFGMNTPIVEAPRTNKRFDHYKIQADVNSDRTNEESGLPKIW